MCVPRMVAQWRCRRRLRRHPALSQSTRAGEHKCDYGKLAEVLGKCCASTRRRRRRSTCRNAVSACRMPAGRSGITCRTATAASRGARPVVLPAADQSTAVSAVRPAAPATAILDQIVNPRWAPCSGISTQSSWRARYVVYPHGQKQRERSRLGANTTLALKRRR